MSVLRHETSRLALVVLIALTARLAFVGWWQQTHVRDPQQFEFPDSRGYWELGQHLAAGEPYQVRLAGPARVSRARISAAVGGNVSRGRAGCIAGVGAGAGRGARGTYRRSRLLVSPHHVWSPLWPCSRRRSSRSIPRRSRPACCRCPMDHSACGWCCSWRSGDRRRSRSAVNRRRPASCLPRSPGPIGGVATLTRPSWLLFTPLLSRFCGHRRLRLRSGRQLALGGAMLAALAITMTPWWIHNWQVTGRFVPTTLWVGPSLYDGLSPDADGSSDMRLRAAVRGQAASGRRGAIRRPRPIRRSNIASTA